MKRKERFIGASRKHGANDSAKGKSAEVWILIALPAGFIKKLYARNS